MKVSVLMPSFNYARYLPSAIESVLSQTHSDLELIITDDCSTDSSRQIVEEWKRRDDRVVPVFHEVNRGLASARNSGLAVSSGAYVAMCDADDLWLAEKLETQLECFQRKPEVGLVHSDSIIIDSDGKPTGERFSSLVHRKGQKTSGNMFEELCERNFLCVPTVIVRREAIQYARGFVDKLRSLEDWVCWIMVSRKYEFDYVEEPLSQYRIHGASLSRNLKSMAHNRAAAIRFLLESFPEIPRHLRSRMLYTLGMSDLEQGAAQSAIKAFADSIRADRTQLRSWMRCCQSLVKFALAGNS